MVPQGSRSHIFHNVPQSSTRICWVLKNVLHGFLKDLKKFENVKLSKKNFPGVAKIQKSINHMFLDVQEDCTQFWKTS